MVVVCFFFQTHARFVQACALWCVGMCPLLELTHINLCCFGLADVVCVVLKNLGVWRGDICI